jgi:DNA polymerase-3 subunit gamma/tau
LWEFNASERPHVAHQSLYRKYRPQTFDDVVGQQHIERTLRNAVTDGTVAHAYLFTGPRGTGKTTTARLLAKALDCQKGPTAEPDGTCEDCIEIAEGRHPDVYELDAASRTGVDNVREEIIGRVSFAPTRGRYKVYIIDEVHMLSVAAFNALLKTLEEPPSHVVFILATTHPHKVPETIHSRCQRFDFHRISIDEIVGRLRFISDGEGFEVPDAALALIARHASGGMRDAITTLEQLASFTGGKIGLADVEGLLGEVDSAALFEISGLIAHREIAGLFRWVAQFAEEGTDLAEFVRELTGHVRNLYLIAAVGDGEGFIDATAEETGRLATQSAEFGGPDRLARMLDLLGELSSELRWSSDQRLSLEVALTRMARPQGEMTLEALAERVEGLERGAHVRPLSAGAGKPSGSGAPQTAADAAEVAKSPEASPAPAPAASEPRTPPKPSTPKSDAASDTSAPGSTVPSAPTPAHAPSPAPGPAPVVHDAVRTGSLDRASAKRAWPAVLIEIKKLRPARASQYSDIEVDVDLDGKTLVLEFPSEAAFAMELADEPEMREMLKQAIAEVVGFSPPFRFQLGRGAVRPVDAPAAQLRPADIDDTPPDHTPDDEPMADYYETATGMTEPVAEAHLKERSSLSSGRIPGGDEPKSELERLLTDELGGHIVAQHDMPGSGGGDAGAMAELEEDPESADLGQDGPGLFDTDGED